MRGICYHDSFVSMGKLVVNIYCKYFSAFLKIGTTLVAVFGRQGKNCAEVHRNQLTDLFYF